MGTIVDGLLEYFKNTPPDQVKRDWQEICERYPDDPPPMEFADPSTPLGFLQKSVGAAYDAQTIFDNLAASEILDIMIEYAEQYAKKGS